MARERTVAMITTAADTAMMLGIPSKVEVKPVVVLGSVVVAVLVVVDVAGPTKFAGSTRGGCGWLKSKEFIISFAWTSLVPRDGRLKATSASLRKDANSYSV